MHSAGKGSIGGCGGGAFRATASSSADVNNPKQLKYRVTELWMGRRKCILTVEAWYLFEESFLQASETEHTASRDDGSLHALEFASPGKRLQYLASRC